MLNSGKSPSFPRKVALKHGCLDAKSQRIFGKNNPVLKKKSRCMPLAMSTERGYTNYSIRPGALSNTSVDKHVSLKYTLD